MMKEKHNSTEFCLRCGALVTAAVSHQRNDLGPQLSIISAQNSQTFNEASVFVPVSQIHFPQCWNLARSIFHGQGGILWTTGNK